MEFFTNSSRSSALKSSDSSQPTILTQNLGWHSFVQSLVSLLPEVSRQILQGVFFNCPPPLDWPPLKMPRLAPPKSFKYENHIEVLRHLDFFQSWGGGQSGTLTFFRNRLLRPTLSKFKGGPVKKHPVNRFVKIRYILAFNVLLDLEMMESC